MSSKRFPYVLGLDIGMSSVGWCVLGQDHIVDLGVRTFDKAESAKKGESLNLVRREARLRRRQLRRRAWRLTKLARLLKRYRIIDDKHFFHHPHPDLDSPWQLRAAGLDRMLDAKEWASVIYHLCKHRGFHWDNRFDEGQQPGDGGEYGRIGPALRTNQMLISDGKRRYRSAAEMMLQEFPEAQRNKRGDYSRALPRRVLGEEFRMLFRRQRELANPYAGAELEALLIGQEENSSGLFWWQQAPMSGKRLLEMTGKCALEQGEYRAPKACFSAERHVWLTRLNNLRISVNGEVRSLNDVERQTVLPLPYRQAGALTYKQTRRALVRSGLLSQDFIFSGLPCFAGAMAGGKLDPDDAILIEMPAWQALRGAFTRAGQEAAWQALATIALQGDVELFDQIGWILTVFKDKTEAGERLAELPLPAGKEFKEALLSLCFSKFHSLSLKALRKVLPHMEAGWRYDQACEKAGYLSCRRGGDAAKRRYLPPLYSGRDNQGRMLCNEELDVPRHPVVLRALNQARKVVNAIIRTYGSPTEVHIEMARDLSKPFDERRSLVLVQQRHREQKARDRSAFCDYFGREPAAREFEKWRLFHEQQGRCAYSLEPIELERLMEPGYVETDHILPYSRSFDDSRSNRALTLTRENRNKSNRTPYEYLDGAGAGERWQAFVAFINENGRYRAAKRQRLLRRDFSEDEARRFRNRYLNDTRHVCRFFKNYVETYLELAPGSDGSRCVVVNGRLTGFLRARWGLTKAREVNDRHHALDAAVVAACSHSMVKRLADHFRSKELGGNEKAVGGEAAQWCQTGFPEPWPHFREELEARLKIDNFCALNEELERIGSLSTETRRVRPLFVSRAPQRRNGGAAHKETIYAQPPRFKAQGKATRRVPLAELTLKDVDRLVDPERNTKLYGAIRERLEAHGGDGTRAFPPGNELRKPDRDGRPTGPVVRTVKMVVDKISGITVRNGIARNDTMLRVDVFCKGGRFYLVPVYVHHRVSGLPDRAIVSGKDEAEWVKIDDSYRWCFPLYPNDLVRVKLKREIIFGYYAGCDRSTGALSLWAHDRDQGIGKGGLIRGIGVKTAQGLEKFNVDVLGWIYPAIPAARPELG